MSPGTEMGRRAGTLAFALLAGIGCAALVVGCSSPVAGTARMQSARDAKAPTVAPDGLDKLLLSDAEVRDVLGMPEVATYRSYAGVTGPQGETYSDPACAETTYNTMWTAYNGSGYSGGAGRNISEPGDKPAHNIDEGVVSFPSADAATRFVVRNVLAWDRCADMHFGTTDPPPKPSTEFYTLGFPRTTGDISTVLNTVEGGEGYVCARALTSRSNVVIDIYIGGKGVTTSQAVALLNAIANKMPH